MAELTRPAGDVRVLWKPDETRLGVDVDYVRAVERFVRRFIPFGIASSAVVLEDDQGQRVIAAWSVADRAEIVEPIEEGTPLP